jgi:hypothetical protein
VEDGRVLDGGKDGIGEPCSERVLIRAVSVYSTSDAGSSREG